MTNYNVTQGSSDPAIFSRQVAQMVRDRAELSREESTPLRRMVSRWYDLYRGYVRARSQPFRNQVHLPMLFSMIEAGVAIKQGLLTGQTPWVEFIPSSPETAASARRTTTLVQQQLQDAHFESKLPNLLRQGDIAGTCPFQWSWKFLKNLRPQRQPVQARGAGMERPGGNPGEQAAMFELVMNEQVDFDGPWFDVIDLLDWYPAPGYPDLTEMPWCIRRYWIDYDDVLRLAQEGVFDPAAVQELATTQAVDDSSAEFETRKAAPGGLRWSNSNLMQRDKFSKPVEIMEMHGVVPNEMIPPNSEGAKNRLITIGNGTTTLRNVPNPIWSGGLPFGVYSPTPDPYSIYGIGKIEPNDKLQATASRLMSQKLDVIDYMIDPMIAYNKLANVDVNRLYSRPGGLVGGDGPPSGWMMPISPDPSGTQQGSQEIEALWRWMQLGTGLTEEVAGLGGEVGSDRQTAREFMGKMENVQRRMVNETLVAARAVLLPLAESFRAMDSQFLPFPTMLRMLGSAALIDPQTGQPIPPDNLINLADVLSRYDMRASSATSLIGKSAKQQNITMILQALGGPMQNPMINWQTFYRWMFREYDVSNPDEFLLPQDQAQANMLQMAGQAAMQAQPPTKQGGQAAKASKPNPDILDKIQDPTSSQAGGGA